MPPGPPITIQSTVTAPGAWRKPIGDPSVG